MKSFIRAITIFAVLNLTTAVSVQAQDAEAEIQQANEEKLEQKGTELVEKAAEVAKRVVDVVQRQTENVLRQKEAALQQAESTISSRLEDMLLKLREGAWQDSGGGTILVVPTAEIKPQELVTIAQDLNIMSRVLDKKLYPGKGSLGLSPWLSASGRYKSLLLGDDHATKGIYMQGYGALFLLKVDFLLSPPPPQVQQEKEIKEESVDPVWEQMKRDMYEPEEARRRKADRPEEKYDAERVESLKITLTRALKHAANIRALKPDEIVILTVISGAGQPAATSLVTRVYSSTNGKSSYIATEPRDAGSDSFSHAVLTIRAKKSDIDAFAKDDLDFDQFRQRTQMLTGTYIGGGEVGLVDVKVRGLNIKSVR